MDNLGYNPYYKFDKLPDPSENLLYQTPPPYRTGGSKSGSNPKEISKRRKKNKNRKTHRK